MPAETIPTAVTELPDTSFLTAGERDKPQSTDIFESLRISGLMQAEQPQDCPGVEPVLSPRFYRFLLGITLFFLLTFGTVYLITGSITAAGIHQTREIQTDYEQVSCLIVDISNKWISVEYRLGHTECFSNIPYTNFIDPEVGKHEVCLYNPENVCESYFLVAEEVVYGQYRLVVLLLLMFFVLNVLLLVSCYSCVYLVKNTGTSLEAQVEAKLRDFTITQPLNLNPDQETSIETGALKRVHCYIDMFYSNEQLIACRPLPKDRVTRGLIVTGALWPLIISGLLMIGSWMGSIAALVVFRNQLPLLILLFFASSMICMIGAVGMLLGGVLGYWATVLPAYIAVTTERILMLKRDPFWFFGGAKFEISNIPLSDGSLQATVVASECKPHKLHYGTTLLVEDYANENSEELENWLYQHLPALNGCASV